MSNDPEQIRREIERTRTDLSDNVNALGEKVNPASIARRQTDRVRGAAVSVKESVFGSASDATDAGQRAIGALGDTVGNAPNAVARRAQGSPIAAGLIAFGAGLLVSSLLPASRPEQDAAQAVKETAQPVVNEFDGGREGGCRQPPGACRAGRRGGQGDGDRRGADRPRRKRLRRRRCQGTGRRVEGEGTERVRLT